MNFRTTSIIFGLLMCMLLVFGIVVQRNAPPDEGFLFPKLRQEKGVEITKVVLDQEGQEYKLEKDKDGNWSTASDSGKEVWRIDPAKVNKLIDTVKKAQRNPEADVPQDDRETGLDKRKIKVTLHGTVPVKDDETEEKEWWLELGNQTADKFNWFARSSERSNKIFAIQTNSIKNLDIEDVNELRSRTLLDVSSLNAEGVTLMRLEKGKVKDEVALTHTKAGLWRFKKPADLDYADFEGMPKEKDQPGLKKVLDELNGMRVEKIGDFVALGNKSFADFGLDDDKESLKIEVKRTEPGKKEPITETLLVGEKIPDSKKKELFYYYVRLAKDKYVAKVDAKAFDLVFEVLKEPKILRSRDIGFFKVDDADAVNIVWPKKGKDVLKLRKIEETTWRMFTEDAKGHKANQAAIDGAPVEGEKSLDKDKSLLYTLQGKAKIRKFFDETDEKKLKDLDKKLGFDDPVAEYSIYVGGLEPEKKDKDKKKKDDEKEEGKDEDQKDIKEPALKKDAKPSVKLIFGDKNEDENWVYVKRIATIDDKESITRVAVPIGIVTKVTPAEGYLAFLDNSLPSFDPDTVKKLEIVRLSKKDGESASEKFVLEKIKKLKEKKDKDKEKDDEKDDEKDIKDKKDKDKKDKGAKDKKPKDEYEEVWELKEPTDLPKQGVDTANIENVIGELAELKVIKWIQKVDPKKADDLKKYGLNDPGSKNPGITVTLTTVKEIEKKKDKKDDKDKGKDDKDKDKGDKDKGDKDKDKGDKDKDKKEEKIETKIFHFGEEGKLDKIKGYYALVDGTDIVFLSAPKVAKFLQNVELRGREVVKFEPEQVREMKLSGWKALYKDFKQTLKITRKDAKDEWKATGPEEFELDQSKASKFAMHMSIVNVKKFVLIKGGPKDVHKLSSKDAALVLTIGLAKKVEEKKDDKAKAGKNDDKKEDKKEEMEEPIVLTIGAMNTEKTAYYAMVSTLPDVVFLVPKEDFDVVEKGLKYLGEKADEEITE